MDEPNDKEREAAEGRAAPPDAGQRPAPPAGGGRAEASEVGDQQTESDRIEEAAFARFHDLPVTLSAQLDRKRVKLREVLDLGVESVLKLERSAGENVDLLMDGAVVGNGEVVVIEDAMGLRITDLTPPGAAGEEKRFGET